MGHEAEADRRLHRSQRAQVTARERGVGGNDEVQILGTVPLATSVAGAATGADPWQQPTRGRSSRPTHHGVRARAAGMAPQQPARRVRRPIMNETCRGPAGTVQHRPERRALQRATWTSWKR